MADLSADEWRELSAQLDHALELDEAERAEWLDVLRRQRPALAQRVADILAAREHAAFSQFLQADPPVPLPQSDAATLNGRAVGAYVIEDEIGRGGMGSVWRARRADGRFEGKVAIKFVHAVWIGRSGEQRFRSEGNLLARLDHPNIARLLDAGVLEGTQPYLVLEYVEGAPIDAYCAQRDLGLEARIRLFLDVLAAVAHAHSHLIVHRDLKPSNVLVNRDGAVKLLDFGIAKLLLDETGVSPLTQSGVQAFTPQYAAPEQLLGGRVTTATDVYALGLVLYVLMTGRHPIATQARTATELIHAMVTQLPQQASTVAGLSTIARRTLEGDIDNILNKALKKAPTERYATVGAFADDLQRFLTHQPVQARADTLRYRTQKFVRRHRGGVTAALLSAVAILAGVVGTLWQAHRAQVNAQLAEQARERAVQQLTYAEASEEFLSFLLEEGSDKPFTTPQLLAHGERMVNRQFANDPAVRARLLFTLGDLYASVEKKERAGALFRAAQRVARRVPNDSVNIEIDCSLAMELADQNDFVKSLKMLDTTVQRAQSMHDLDPAILAACLDQRSQVHRIRSEFAAALADAKAALALLGVPRVGQRTLALSIRTTLAHAQADLGDRASAAHEYERAIDELGLMGRGQTNYAVTLLNSLGVLLAKSGQWQRAGATYERALLVARGVAGVGDISPMTTTNYAKVLINLGRAREALPMFDAAMQSAAHRSDKHGQVMVELMSAPAFCELGNLEECGARLSRSAATLRRQLPAGNVTLATIAAQEAQLALARGQLPLAQERLHTAFAIFATLPKNDPIQLRALDLQIQLEQRLGAMVAATAHTTEYVAKARAALGGFAGSAWLGRALLVQGEMLLAQNKRDEARATLRQALAMLRDTENGDWTRRAQQVLARAG